MNASLVWPDRYFRTGALLLSVYISALHKKGSGTLPLAHLCQPPSGILGVNCLPIKHRCLYILLQVMRYVHDNEFSKQEAVIEYIVCE